MQSIIKQPAWIIQCSANLVPQISDGKEELICLGDLKFASKAESLEGILKIMVGRIMPAKGN